MFLVIFGPFVFLVSEKVFSFAFTSPGHLEMSVGDSRSYLYLQLGDALFDGFLILSLTIFSIFLSVSPLNFSGYCLHWCRFTRFDIHMRKDGNVLWPLQMGVSLTISCRCRYFQ